MSEIYAEITKKMLNQINDNGFLFRLPTGVELHRKKHSRACYFECSDEHSTNNLIELLDYYHINWQDNN